MMISYDCVFKPLRHHANGLDQHKHCGWTNVMSDTNLYELIPIRNDSSLL